MIITWLLVLGVLLGGFFSFGTSYASPRDVPDSQAKQGFELLAEHYDGLGTGWAGFVVFKAESGVQDPVVQEAMTAYLEAVDEIEGVLVQSPYGLAASTSIAEGGKIARAPVTVEQKYGQGEVGEKAHEMLALQKEYGLDKIEGLQVELGGEALGPAEPPESEALGLAFAVFILIVATGSVVAMGMTVASALVGVGVGAITAMLCSHVFEIPDFALTIALMIGIGVGIDYALFIVNRYREATRVGLDPLEATSVAMDTAGRSVVFAGVTVVVSLLGLILIGLSFTTGLGITAAIVVSVVMAGSVTLLPASIGLVKNGIETTRVGDVVIALIVSVGFFAMGLGYRSVLYSAAVLAVVMLGLVVLQHISTRKNPGAKGGLLKRLPQRTERELRDTYWYRLSRRVQSSPWLFATVGVALLLALAAPMTKLDIGFPDESNYPKDTTTYRAYQLTTEGFGEGANGPILLVGEVESFAEILSLGPVAEGIKTLEGVADVDGPFPSMTQKAVLIQVEPATSPQEEATYELVHRIADEVVPQAKESTGIELFTTGTVPAYVDFQDYLSARTPMFFAAVLVLSFILLMMVFRSILVPLKAVIMNMLSISAAYGVCVAIFQFGWGGSLFNVRPAPIEPFIPMMLFAVLFGLSMDYEVFLLSRIKEEFVRTGEAVNSVADGLAATARVITAAAAIMVVVFLSFVFEDLRVIKLFGVGLATAVFLDATLVRMIIVPSTMELLGERNWWFPKVLDRFLPRLNVEGTVDLHELAEQAKAKTSQESAI